MGPCESYLALPAKKEVGTRHKLRQATQIPTQRHRPYTYHNTQNTSSIYLASTAARIANASTQQTLLAPRVVHWPVYAVSAQGGAISLADAPPSSIVQYSTVQSNISITVYGMQQHWADTRSIEHISCFPNQIKHTLQAHIIKYNRRLSG